MSTPGSETLQWDKVRGVISNLSNRHVHKLIRLARRELTDRHQAAEALNKRAADGFRAMANFMAGVTWALACRASLRESKGHDPAYGKRPAAGDMWLPRELLTAVRHQVKARGWHPITAPDWTNVQCNLEAEQRRTARGVTPEQSFQAVQFRIPFARQEARQVINDRFDSYIDLGGEG